MQILEYEGKNYVTAEEYIGENRNDKYWDSEDFYPTDLDYYDYLGISYSETKENRMFEEDIDTLRGVESDSEEYFGDTYRVLLEVDENNHPVGTSDLFLNLTTNEVVNSQVVFDEFIGRIEEADIQGDYYDYDFNDDSLYKELNEILNSVQNDNMETVRIIDSGIKRDDVINFCKDYIKENVLDNSTGGLKEEFRDLTAEYNPDKKFKNKNFQTVFDSSNAFDIIRKLEPSFVDILQEKFPIPLENYERFESTSLFSAMLDMRKELDLAFYTQKYETDDVIKSEGRRFCIAEDYLSKTDNNKDFRPEKIGFSDSPNEELKDFKILLELDKYNKVIGFPDDVVLNGTEVEDVQKLGLSEDLRNELNTVSENVKKAVTVAEFKDLTFTCDTLIKNFIVDDVINSEEECLKPKFVNEQIEELSPEEFLQDIKDRVFEEASTKGTMLNSWVHSFDQYSLTDDRYKERNDIVLEACIGVAVERNQDDLLHSFEMEKLQKEIENEEPLKDDFDYNYGD